MRITEQSIQIEGAAFSAHQLAESLVFCPQGQPKAEERNAELLQYFRMQTRQGLADEHPAKPVFACRSYCVDEGRTHGLRFFFLGGDFPGSQTVCFVHDNEGVEPLASLI